MIRLLADALTGPSVFELDGLFDDRGIALGSPRPRENDESVRRERMRWYLVSLDVKSAADTHRFIAVFSDVLQKTVQDASIGWGDYAPRDTWTRILHRLGDSAHTDPRLAVSTAKALIESTAKCVRTARGQSYIRAAKVPGLVNAAPAVARPRCLFVACPPTTSAGLVAPMAERLNPRAPDARGESRYEKSHAPRQAEA